MSFAPVADLNRILGKGDISGMPKDVVLASFVASILWFGSAGPTVREVKLAYINRWTRRRAELKLAYIAFNNVVFLGS